LTVYMGSYTRLVLIRGDNMYTV